LRQYFPDAEIITGNNGDKKPYATKFVKDLTPFSIGELAICFMYTPGHTDDSCCIAVTHINETSTKLPFLFTGDTLLIG